MQPKNTQTNKKWNENTKDIKCLITQFMQLYGNNLRAPYPLNLVFTSCNGQILQTWQRRQEDIHRGLVEFLVVFFVLFFCFFFCLFTNLKNKRTPKDKPQTKFLKNNKKINAHKKKYEICDESLEIKYAKEFENMIYLTGDSENIIETIENNKIYVIGAWVDHNKYPGYTLQMAQKKGWKTASLPLLKYMQRDPKMPTRKIITVNQGYSILFFLLFV